jgi:hypothetical protein
MRVFAKKGIALLITLFFLMAITISIGIGFKHVNEAKSSIKDENFLLQTNIILDDVLTFLQNSPEIKEIKKNDELLDIFLAQSELIPFDISDIKVLISIKSARRKVNINNLLETNSTTPTKQILRFKEFLTSYNVNPSYVDMLEDSVSKHDDNYIARTDILDAKPDIFRDYIASYKHLEEINEFYTNTNYDNSLEDIDFKDLFYFGRDTNTSKTASYCIDNNYMEPWARHMVEGVSLEDAEAYVVVDSNETEVNGFNLCSGEDRLFLDVNLEITQDEKKAKIGFEYDIKQTKGYNFSYEI